MLDDERTSAPPKASASSAPATGDGSAEPAAPRKTTRRRKATAAPETGDSTAAAPSGDAEAAPKKTAAPRKRTAKKAAPAAEVETPSGPPIPATAVIFQAPEPAAPAKAAKKTAAKKTAAKKTAAHKTAPHKTAEAPPEDAAIRSEERVEHPTEGGPDGEAGGSEPAGPTGTRRRRGRRGRGRGGAGEGAAGDAADEAADDVVAGADGGAGDEGDGSGDDGGEETGEDGETTGTGARRRRRRRRRGAGGGTEEVVVDDDGVETVVHVREPKPKPAPRAPRDTDDDVKGVKGSTRLEAKRQRRRDGRDSGRRRPPIITEAEFLARRESVDRVMVVRQGPERTQIGVLEDGVLVEHYVARKDHASMVGNVYLGKVQNVLPSMEAAFVDIGRGRNAVLYAGEVNYDASALEGRPPRIEQALKSGQSVLVQVTKDPIGHKGARLTSQVSLPGRYMVYVRGGRLSGISRKLPDTERTRLKTILKRLMPEEAGVIIRTAAEGASEDELERDLKRLQAQWEDIEKKVQTASAPSQIYSEPDVVIRVIRDIFNEDFKELVVSGDDEWDTVDNYVRWVAPDLADRSRKWTDEQDVFAAYRIDEQLAKALDRKVWLPSGGYLVIDRTEAMIVVDVNTGKFTGKGGNLEETVTSGGHRQAVG